MKPVFSLLYCAYNNSEQFNNSMWTATQQTFPGPYEIFVVDNATPDDSIAQVYENYMAMIAVNPSFRYWYIEPEKKRCTNITQGINLAAQMAAGEYIVIVADSNVLLSFNLLDKIYNLIDPDTLVLSTGPTNDVKISPGGTKESEYAWVSPAEAAKINDRLLKKMGWPCDPLNLKLISGHHRYPPPHQVRDCYIAAMAKDKFTAYGGYDESNDQWGPYHEFFLDNMAAYLDKEKHLTDVKIVHQYHRVLKGHVL